MRDSTSEPTRPRPIPAETRLSWIERVETSWMMMGLRPLCTQPEELVVVALEIVPAQPDERFVLEIADIDPGFFCQAMIRRHSEPDGAQVDGA